MAAPSKLAINTSSVLRLVRDKQSYHNEEKYQENRIKDLESQTSNDENAGYLLKQERRALEETRAMIPNLDQRILEASHKLKQQLMDERAAGSASEEDRSSAEEALRSVGINP